MHICNLLFRRNCRHSAPVLKVHLFWGLFILKESIYTIPISEIFEPKQGCPLCALYKNLDERWVDYITGAAMMEPDIRVETNKRGFCYDHFEKMLGMRNRLSVALILQTRLDYVNETLEDKPAAKRAILRTQAGGGSDDDCFVCSRITREFGRIGENIAAFWLREPEFRNLYADQQFICLMHYHTLSRAAEKTMRHKEYALFQKETARLTRKKLLEAKENIDQFCNLFDYRSAAGDRPPQEVAGAIEAAIEYLTGER